MRSRILGILLTVLAVIVPVTPAVTAETGGSDISPGTTVVFVAGEYPETAIMQVDPGVGLPTMVADLQDGPDIQPTVGPAGQVAWIRRNGSQWELVENARVISAGEMHFSPAYRPDGALVAAVSEVNDTSLYVFQSGSRTLLIRGNGIAVSPSFSPDGSRMAFVSDETGQGEIFVAATDGQAAVKLTASPKLSTDPAWSHTGEYIAFVADEADICLVRPDGSGRMQLTRNQGHNGRPNFSPDGQMIVFFSDRNGFDQLFVMNLDGSDQRPLLPGYSRPQSQPVWTSVKPSPIVD